MKPLTLPPLPYPEHALEPAIDRKIMERHYHFHHKAYVDQANIALQKLEAALAAEDTQAILSLQQALRFHLGGHINHSIFWATMAPVGEGGEPSGELSQALHQAFGSVEQFKEQMSAMAKTLQGSGWVWLAMEPGQHRLLLHPTQNQDALQPTTGLLPLLGIDVWEHAYYLQYLNARPAYVDAWWSVVNWRHVHDRWVAAKQS